MYEPVRYQHLHKCGTSFQNAIRYPSSPGVSPDHALFCVFFYDTKKNTSIFYRNYTTKLLNLEDVIITNVENIYEKIHVYLDLPRAKHRRSACGALIDRVRNYRIQTFHLAERRCYNCGKRFYEKNIFPPRYYRSTGRLVVGIINAFREMVSAAKIGAQFNVFGTTAMRYFKYIFFKPTKL